MLKNFSVCIFAVYSGSYAVCFLFCDESNDFTAVFARDISQVAKTDYLKRRDAALHMKLLASRAGSRIDVSKLANVSGLSRITVQNYLELFEKTYLIQLLPVHTKSADREIVKAKKLYFSDTGILNILSQVNGGAQFENTVFCQLRHQGELRYYSLKSGQEIDFILDQKIALEIKEIPTMSDYQNLVNLAKKAGLSSVRLIGRYASPKFRKYLWGGIIR